MWCILQCPTGFMSLFIFLHLVFFLCLRLDDFSLPAFKLTNTSPCSNGLLKLSSEIFILVTIFVSSRISYSQTSVAFLEEL